MSLVHRPSLVFVAAIALLTGAAAKEIPTTDSLTREIHAGVNAPAKEISPGLYSHEFEHVAKDGIRTSISYLARKVKHLVHLDDAEVGLVSLTCQDGDVVEVTVTNASAPPSWIVASAEVVNATILVGTDNITCDGVDNDQESQILHRVVERLSSSCLVRTLLLASTCTDYAQRVPTFLKLSITCSSNTTGVNEMRPRPRLTF